MDTKSMQSTYDYNDEIALLTSTNQIAKLEEESKENKVVDSAQTEMILHIYSAVSGTVTEEYVQNAISGLASTEYVFIECRYNGTKVTENNFDKVSRVLNLYNIGGNGQYTDSSTIAGLNIYFE